MLNKFEILIVIFILLLTFYFVISLAVYKKDKSSISKNIKNYLFNVRILILFIGVVASILTFFM
jgi:magnesium-transporting ATPase (P-type)